MIVDAILFYAVRAWHTTAWWLRKLCPHDEDYVEYVHDEAVVYTREGTRIRPTGGGLSREHPYYVDTIVRYRAFGRSDTRCVVVSYDTPLDAPEYTYDQIFASNIPPPWLAISCDSTDMTADLAPYVCKGNRITLDFLNTVFNRGNWRYLNPTTFEECDFPSEGILI